jgi:hypothetical protein
MVDNGGSTGRHAQAILRLCPDDGAPLLDVVHCRGESGGISRVVHVNQRGNIVDVGMRIRGVDHVSEVLLRPIWPVVLTALAREEDDRWIHHTVCQRVGD